MSRARPSLCGGASPAGNRISCCEWLVLPSLTPWHLAGPPWCHLGLTPLLPLPHVHPSALSPKLFPNPAPSFSLVPPASAPASRCNLPSAICSSPGSHRDIFKTANHILSLSRLACGSSTSEQNPHGSPQPPRRPGPCDPSPTSICLHLPGSSVPATAPLQGSSNAASLFPPQDLCTCSPLLLPAPPSWLLLILPVSAV